MRQRSPTTPLALLEIQCLRQFRTATVRPAIAPITIKRHSPHAVAAPSTGRPLLGSHHGHRRILPTTSGGPELYERHDYSSAVRRHCKSSQGTSCPSRRLRESRQTLSR